MNIMAYINTFEERELTEEEKDKACKLRNAITTTIDYVELIQKLIILNHINPLNNYETKHAGAIKGLKDCIEVLEGIK